MHTAVQILLVAVGSALGGLTRWGVSLWFERKLGPAFPWGTLFINLTGSLFLGWFATVLSEKLVLSGSSWLRPDDLRLLVAVGLTGAYTTFSTFEWETFQLIRDGSFARAFYNVGGSFLAGLLAVFLGVMLANGLFPRR